VPRRILRLSTNPQEEAMPVTSRKPAAAAVALVAVVAVVAGTTQLARAAGRSSRRLVFVEHELAAPTLDLGRHGFSPLDRQTITSDVLDLRGRVVGRLDDDCAITAVGRRAGAVCSFAITLPGGQLVGTRFDAFGPGEALQPITGGSGAYVGARGQIRPLKKTGRGLEFAIELTD
jgi:hypothetical protein